MWQSIELTVTNEQKLITKLVENWLKFGTLGAESVCGIGPNSRGDFADIMKSGQCVAGALGAALVKLVTLS